MIESAQFRHLITIKSPDNTLSDTGKHTPTYTTFATVWASIVPLSSKEELQAQQLGVTTTHRIVIRYLAGVNENQQIVFGSRTFAINSVINTDERNRELVLNVSEAK